MPEIITARTAEEFMRTVVSAIQFERLLALPVDIGGIRLGGLSRWSRGVAGDK